MFAQMPLFDGEQFTAGVIAQRLKRTYSEVSAAITATGTRGRRLSTGNGYALVYTNEDLDRVREWIEKSA